MAYRDGDPKHPQAAQKSVELFQAAPQAGIPGGWIKGKLDKGSPPPQVLWMRAVLVRFPDLAHATAEALARNAANGARLPAALADLRDPRTLNGKQ